MPRHGIGIDISTLAGSEGVVTTIDDFVFESFSAGQMHPILTTSRTNLVTSSEDFTSDWVVDDVTFDVNSTTAPDGTSTADKIIGSTVSSRHNIVDTGLTNTVTASISVHAKAGELRYLQVASANTANQHANFDLLTGTIGNIGSDFANVAMDSLANGWYRITLTSVGRYNSFYLSLVSGLTASWLESWSMSNNTDGLFLWGAQLEEDGFASAYIPTSGSTVTVSTTLNDTSEVWDFDSTDIMLEADPEDEGFWEEGSNIVLNGDYEQLGSELASFSDNNIVFTDLSDSTTISLGSNSYRSEAFGNTNDSRPRVTVNGSGIVTGKTYKVVYTPTSFTGSTVFDFWQNGSRFVNNHDASLPLTFYFVASNSFDGFDFDGSQTFRSDYTLSIKQVDPNDRWALDSGWSISDGKAVAVATSSSGFSITQNNVLTAGVPHEITFTVSERTAGNVRFRANAVSGTTRGADGTYTEIITPAGHQFAIQGLDSFVGKIDNVTVREYAIQPKDI